MTTNRIGAIIAAHKKSGRGGVVSVCSAHPAVIRAAAELAAEYGATLLLESTSNQVDQFGGYTGLTPAQYIAQVKTLLPADANPVYGGDHLGPNRWQHLPADEAMKNSEELIRHYIKAGYEKIHLDCSMSCAGDPVPLPDATVAERATALSAVANEFPHAVFEAHSTDYQMPQAFKELVRDHFAILKVGPALTFAWREALYALNHIARELKLNAPDVEAAAETLMQAEPAQWQKYYHGDADEQRLLRHYSLSDRIRYYWTKPQLNEAVQGLLAALGERPLPFGLAHQYLPDAVEACRARHEALTADNLIRHHIRAALIPYYEACA